jgi:hypothetical protein
MKKIKTVAVCLVIAHILYNHISNIWYYKPLIESASDLNKENLQSLFQQLLWWLTDLLTIICGILFLISTVHKIKDRAYTLLRFVYVISAFLFLPHLVYYFIMVRRHGFNTDFNEVFRFLTVQTIWLFCAIALIINKPERPVQKINLSDYELVNYTSTGHRFLHYFLDLLFLIPVVGFWSGYWPELNRSPLGMELLFVGVYFIYCFIAEAFFRQTFGKMITGSCIVSNGTDLSTGRVLIRTLSRLIPFDKLSFLFGGNWHDRLSSTTVVYIDSWQKMFDEPPAQQPDKP